jgi:4-alpha-glucanotransferase
MRFERASGILLHPTSLPGPYGIGDLGPQAYRWLDFLAESGCKLWQILPLGPTGFGDSPYQCFSAFAGNPYLVSPEKLLEDGLLSTDDLVECPQFPVERVDYGAVIPWKLGILDRAYIQFQQNPPEGLRQEFETFRAAQVSWMNDFALFMALKEAHGGSPWNEWPASLRQRNEEALELARKQHAVAIQRQEFRQFLFFRQWSELRIYARERDIRIIGDLPIFVAYDSTDVWMHPDLFFLDGEGKPTVVAGVPPDYFSSTGQLWGNPLYRWELHAERGYVWWLARLRATLEVVDTVRLDHFRGFAGYWEIPAGNPTAEVGQWIPAPGHNFLRAVEKALGKLPIIAEDLGVITPDVVALRQAFDLPGMKILQFAFSGPGNEFLPHHYPYNCVVYTGTHDNDTTRGWYESAPRVERDFARRYLGCSGKNFVWKLIRLAWSSVAIFALAPMQDFLDLGSEARMNYPSTPSGNWQWRMSPNALTDELKGKVKELNRLYSR